MCLLFRSKYLNGWGPPWFLRSLSKTPALQHPSGIGGELSHVQAEDGDLDLCHVRHRLWRGGHRSHFAVALDGAPPENTSALGSLLLASFERDLFSSVLCVFGVGKRRRPMCLIKRVGVCLLEDIYTP